MNITAILDTHGRLTGQYQKGDWSRHKDFDPTKHIVMDKEEFDEWVDMQNKDVKRLQERQEQMLPRVIPMDELYPHGIENSLCGIGERADNFWK